MTRLRSTADERRVAAYAAVSGDAVTLAPYAPGHGARRIHAFDTDGVTKADTHDGLSDPAAFDPRDDGRPSGPSRRIEVQQSPTKTRQIDLPSERRRQEQAALLGRHGACFAAYLHPGQLVAPQLTADHQCPHRGATRADHAAWGLREYARRGYATCLSVDLKSAFPNLSSKAVRRVLHKIGFSRGYADGIWHLARIDAVDRYGRRVRSRRSVGVEQGSPLSGVLLELVLAEILFDIEKWFDCMATTYVDDLYLQVRDEETAREVHACLTARFAELGMTNVPEIGVGEKAAQVIDMHRDPVLVLRTYQVTVDRITLSARFADRARRWMRAHGVTSFGVRRFRRTFACVAADRRALRPHLVLTDPSVQDASPAASVARDVDVTQTPSSSVPVTEENPVRGGTDHASACAVTSRTADPDPGHTRSRRDLVVDAYWVKDASAYVSTLSGDDTYAEVQNASPCHGGGEDDESRDTSWKRCIPSGVNRAFDDETCSLLTTFSVLDKERSGNQADWSASKVVHRVSPRGDRTALSRGHLYGRVGAATSPPVRLPLDQEGVTHAPANKRRVGVVRLVGLGVHIRGWSDERIRRHLLRVLRAGRWQNRVEVDYYGGEAWTWATTVLGRKDDPDLRAVRDVPTDEPGVRRCLLLWRREHRQARPTGGDRPPAISAAVLMGARRTDISTGTYRVKVGGPAGGDSVVTTRIPYTNIGAVVAVASAARQLHERGCPDVTILHRATVDLLRPFSFVTEGGQLEYRAASPANVALARAQADLLANWEVVDADVAWVRLHRR